MSREHEAPLQVTVTLGELRSGQVGVIQVHSNISLCAKNIICRSTMGTSGKPSIHEQILSIRLYTYLSKLVPWPARKILKLQNGL